VTVYSARLSTVSEIEPLAAYVNALDDASLPEAQFQWTTHHTALVRTTVPAGDLVSVQFRCTPAGMQWQAAGLCRSGQDALGLILLKPETAGPIEISLYYDGGAEMRWLRLLSAISVLGYFSCS